MAAPVRIPAESTMSEETLVSRWIPFIREASSRLRHSHRLDSGGADGRKRRAHHVGRGRPRSHRRRVRWALMQVMPASWQTMQGTYALGNDPYDPRSNILAGTAVLHALYVQYGYPGLFAAYNDGPGMVDARRQAGQRLPDETIAYVLEFAHILRTGHRRSHEPAHRSEGYRSDAGDGRRARQRDTDADRLCRRRGLRRLASPGRGPTPARAVPC